MNIQQVIAKIAADPRLGGFDATNGTCAYRTPDGFACALGCLISDDAFRTLFASEDFQAFFNGDIDEKLLNVVAPIGDLCCNDEDLLESTGLNLQQADILQEFHDSFNVSEQTVEENRNDVREAFNELASAGAASWGPNSFSGGARDDLTLEHLAGL